MLKDHLKKRPGISIILLYLPFVLFSFVEPLYWMNSRPINGAQFNLAAIVIGILFKAPLVLSFILLKNYSKSSIMVKMVLFFLLAYGMVMLRATIVQSRKTVHMKQHGTVVTAKLMEVTQIGRFKQFVYSYSLEDGKTYYRVIDDWNRRFSQERDKEILLRVSKKDARINLLQYLN